MAKTFIKYGGLLMSSVLTLALFLTLFGRYGDFYAWLLAGSALVLFEGGTILWGKMIDPARGNQRGIAKLSMWICVGLSITSSCLQIIMSTDLWKPEFDTGLVALFTIAIALAVNVIGAILYEFFDPDRAEKNMDLDRAARARNEMYKLSDKVAEKAFLKAGGLVEEVSGKISLALAEEMRIDVQTYLLSQTRNGEQSMQLPSNAAQQTINQPAATTHPEAAPSLVDSIKQRLGVQPQPAPMATMASDAPAPAQNGNGHGPAPLA